MTDAIRETAERLLQRLDCPSGSPYAGQFLEMAKIDLRNALKVKPPAQPADWRQLCGELLRGLDENRHPEVRYPGDLRLVMAAARAALLREPAPAPAPAPKRVVRVEEDLLSDGGYEAGTMWTGHSQRHAAARAEHDTGELVAAALTALAAEPPAPAPAADGEREELAQWLDHKGRGAWPCPDGFSAKAEAEEYEMFSGLTRAAALLRQLPPEGLLAVEYVHIDSGARIICEPNEECSGGHWAVLNSRHVNPCTEFRTVADAVAALQQARAKAIPQPPQGAEAEA